MERKKIIIHFLLSVVLCFGILGSPCINVNAAENSTQELETLPQKVIDIINGSDDIYGDGVAIEHGVTIEHDDGLMHPNFQAGGVDHTHQYIVASAVNILQSDKGNSIFSNATHLENLLYFTDWPDEFGNETDYGTFAGHFYDPDTGKNWLGQTSPTAKGRSVDYYNEAVKAYKAGKTALAIRYIGIGSHYISDLNVPHHAANLTALNSNHTDFERYVDNTRASYKIPGDTLPDSLYTEAKNNSVENLAISAAVHAKSLVSQAQETSTYSYAAEKSVTHAITNVVQYFYKFCVEVGIFN